MMVVHVLLSFLTLILIACLLWSDDIFPPRVVSPGASALAR